MQFLIVLAILLLVVLVVTGPLRRAARERLAGAVPENPAHDLARARLAELEADREAKYREIRDAELDHQTGKLSDADFDALDAALRAEALAILRDLDRAQAQAATIAGR